MKRLFLLFAYALSFSEAPAQKPVSNTFVRLTAAAGQQLAGDAVERGFERWMIAGTLSTSGKKNEVVTFTMAPAGAGADLKKAFVNGEPLSGGEVDVLRPANGEGRRLPSAVIKMEEIKVLNCTDAVGCNGAPVLNVTLQAARIGWIYYDPNKPTLVIAARYGYDVARGTDWTAF